MLTNKKKSRIQERLKNTIPIETPGAWYHEDIPMLLRALNVAEKTCPNGGNDGYITPRPCQVEREIICDFIKFGKWIEKYDHNSQDYYEDKTYYSCSLCEKGWLKYKGNFCPNCGANMKGSEI